jgi:hypothetical protein
MTDSRVRERRIYSVSVAGLVALAGCALMFAGSLRDWATHENVFVGGSTGVWGMHIDGVVTISLAAMITVAAVVLFRWDHPWVRGTMLGLSIGVLVIGLAFLADLSDKAGQVGEAALDYGLGDGLVWLISGSAIAAVGAMVTVEWELRVGRRR